MVHLSRKAKEDLRNIGQHTQTTWGNTQAIRYISSLRDCCQWLSESPAMGRIAGLSQPDIRRFEQESHVIFYCPSEDGILVVRILHKHMLADLHSVGQETS